MECRRLHIFTLTLLIGLGCALPSQARKKHVKDKVNKSARALTITSEPAGSRVDFNGQYMGVTPLYLTYDKSFFEGHGAWVWSRYLSEAVNMVVSTPGCSKSVEITRGPYNWQNGLGTVSEDYYVFTSSSFDVQLDCSASASEPRRYNDRYLTQDSAPAASPGGEAPSGPVTLAIAATQGSAVDSAKNLVLLYCITHRLTIVGWQLSMNLTVTVGSAMVTFRQNGTREVRLDSGDQSYSIGGQSVVAFRVVNSNGGGGGSIRVTYSYVGEGSVPLGGGGSQSPIPLSLRTTNSRVVSMDLSSGEAESEETISLVRS